MILFTSIVRDAELYLDRYFSQLKELNNLVPCQLLITEGDSVDNTLSKIEECPVLFYCYKQDHNGQKFGSVDNPVRWKNIAQTWNWMYDNFSNWKAYKAIVYMEADLIWTPETILSLIEGLSKFHAVSPLVMLRDTSIFYDIWGYRDKNGKHFFSNPPYHEDLEKCSERYYPLSSAGSCIVMQPRVLRTGCRLSEKDAMIGHDLRKHGYALALDTQQKIYHP